MGFGTIEVLKAQLGATKVKGLIINRFSSNGIVVRTNGGKFIETNYIGTDASGTVDLGTVSQFI